MSESMEGAKSKGGMMVPNHYSDNDYNKAQSMKKNILLAAKYEYKGEERKERKKERKKKKNKTCSDCSGVRIHKRTKRQLLFLLHLSTFLLFESLTDCLGNLVALLVFLV
jgi:hypothetical protein